MVPEQIYFESDDDPLSKQALSNLAFLELANEEKDTLTARYKALRQQTLNQANSVRAPEEDYEDDFGDDAPFNLEEGAA